MVPSGESLSLEAITSPNSILASLLKGILSVLENVLKRHVLRVYYQPSRTLFMERIKVYVAHRGDGFENVIFLRGGSLGMHDKEKR